MRDGHSAPRILFAPKLNAPHAPRVRPVAQPPRRAAPHPRPRPFTAACRVNELDSQYNGLCKDLLERSRSPLQRELSELVAPVLPDPPVTLWGSHRRGSEPE